MSIYLTLDPHLRLLICLKLFQGCGRPSRDGAIGGQRPAGHDQEGDRPNLLVQGHQERASNLRPSRRLRQVCGKVNELNLSVLIFFKKCQTRSLFCLFLSFRTENVSSQRDSNSNNQSKPRTPTTRIPPRPKCIDT